MAAAPPTDIEYHIVQPGEVPLVESWLQADHVRPYFHGDGLANTLRDLHSPTLWTHWIATLDKPMAYLMTSEADAFYDTWSSKPGRAITLDLLIGPAEYLGRGLAVPLIQLFLATFSDVVEVFIDPEATNARAIHVYERAGFVKLEQYTPDYNPTPHWMMRLPLGT